LFALPFSRQQRFSGWHATCSLPRKGYAQHLGKGEEQPSMREPVWGSEEFERPTPSRREEGFCSTLLAILTLGFMLVLIVGVSYLVVTNVPGPGLPVRPSVVTAPSPAAPTPTLALSPTSTPAQSPTSTPTQSPTPTLTQSPTPTPTATPTATPTPSPKPTPTATPTPSPTGTRGWRWRM
jgi:cell division septation protein DedD